MYLECRGSGSATVVLVAGLKASAGDWNVAEPSGQWNHRGFEIRLEQLDREVIRIDADRRRSEGLLIDFLGDFVRSVKPRYRTRQKTIQYLFFPSLGFHTIEPQFVRMLGNRRGKENDGG